MNIELCIKELPFLNYTAIVDQLLFELNLFKHKLSMYYRSSFELSFNGKYVFFKILKIILTNIKGFAFL